MGYKLRTSKKTEDILCRIETSENLPWPTLMRLAISLSIKQGSLMEIELFTDSQGRELNRQTVTGEFDTMYKCLIELTEGQHLTDDEFFPQYLKGHLDRGAVLLEREHKYSKDFIVHLSNLDAAI